VINRKEYDRTYHIKHKEQITLTQKKYAEKHREEIKEYQRLYRLNPENKLRDSARHRKWYLRHREEIKLKQNKRKLEFKRKVLTYYGNGKCACVVCNESRLACLSIDHIEGGGNKHRHFIGNRGGMKFYYWLKLNGYPKGYQTLCMNCQRVKQVENNEY